MRYDHLLIYRKKNELFHLTQMVNVHIILQE